MVQAGNIDLYPMGAQPRFKAIIEKSGFGWSLKMRVGLLGSHFIQQSFDAFPQLSKIFGRASVVGMAVWFGQNILHQVLSIPKLPVDTGIQDKLCRNKGFRPSL